jgi:cysteine synthase B
LKLEGNNPGGSLKIVLPTTWLSALERGDIKKGDKLIEATSGNTGIALAMIAQLLDIEIEYYPKIQPKNVLKLCVLMAQQ